MEDVEIHCFLNRPTRIVRNNQWNNQQNKQTVTNSVMHETLTAENGKQKCRSAQISYNKKWDHSVGAGMALTWLHRRLRWFAWSPFWIVSQRICGGRCLCRPCPRWSSPGTQLHDPLCWSCNAMQTPSHWSPLQHLHSSEPPVSMFPALASSALCEFSKIPVPCIMAVYVFIPQRAGYTWCVEVLHLTSGLMLAFRTIAVPQSPTAVPITSTIG